jgi:hypothetical protein
MESFWENPTDPMMRYASADFSDENSGEGWSTGEIDKISL